MSGKNEAIPLPGTRYSLSFTGASWTFARNSFPDEQSVEGECKRQADAFRDWAHVRRKLRLSCREWLRMHVGPDSMRSGTSCSLELW
ncbi:MAG: hypothetical protein NTNFB02_15370 [Nitrospira sp.]